MMNDTAESRPSPDSGIDVSVVICTRNRVDSLLTLLTALSGEDTDELLVEIVIVDNNSTDGTRAAVESFGGNIRIRYLFEEKVGKCHALNRALDEGRLGDIVAFIDDDLAPERGWVKEVKATCDRWPDHDIFGGRTHVIFPDDEQIPGWAHDKRTHPLAFSVADCGESDIEITRGHWPTGGFFWLRSRVLTGGRRFPNLWLTEPGLLLGLQEDGCKGIWSGTVSSGHRIQPDLLRRETILRRMAQFGRELPYVIMPNPGLFRQARFFRDYPYLYVPLCLLKCLRWSLRLAQARLLRDADAQFVAEIQAIRQLCDRWETVCHWRRMRSFARAYWLRNVH